jgi:hypothetical protein
MRLQIRTFYLVGAVLMIFSVIGVVWSNIISWENLNTGAKLSGVTSILFQLLWLGLFAFLYKMTPEQPTVKSMKVVDVEEIDAMIKELNIPGGNTNESSHTKDDAKEGKK